MDVFMLVATIIASVISLLVDLYLIVIYVHRDEPICNPISMFCRILVLLSLLQVQLQPLFLLYDAMNSQIGGPDISMFWIVIYFTILVNIAFLKPLGTSLYEADEEDPCWKKTLWTIIQVIITLIVFGVLLGVGWLFWGTTYLPITQITTSEEYTEGQQITQNTSQNYLQLPVTIPSFLIGLLCLLGYPILACCGACGMTALPISMISDFKNRPKWRRTSQARKITDQLKKQTVELIKEADKIRRAINRVDYIDGWFAKRKKNQELQTVLCDIQNKVQRHRDLYELFRLELNMAEANPIFFILKLVGGVFLLFVIVPLIWVQILLSQFLFPSGVFIDQFFIVLTENGAGFVAIALIFLLTFYMVISTLRGIFFVSQSLPFISIHPIAEGRTWLNSFLFQTSLATLAAASMIHLLVTTFPQFLRSGDIAIIMGNVIEGMLVIGVLLNKKVFIYIYLIMTVLGLIWSIVKMCCLNQKSDAQLKIEGLRKKLFKKQEQTKQISIQMTQMNLIGKEKTPRKGEESKQSHKKKSKKKKVILNAV